MTMPANVDVSDSTREVLTALTMGDPDLLAARPGATGRLEGPEPP